MCGAAAAIHLLHQRAREEENQRQTRSMFPSDEKISGVVHKIFQPKVDEAKKLLGEIDKLTQQAELAELEAKLAQNEKYTFPTFSVQDIQNLRK
ncbi:coil containing protein [Vibrio phage 2.275.O._10N.286.54.E11]|nr:coil containing protein [Vibrio phage 2.275.O._10N.286.54.E11]